MKSGSYELKIGAVFADYDGTLCPTADVRTGMSVPQTLGETLLRLSERVPVCIISSKDSHFLLDRTPFASVLSCILGIETLAVKRRKGALAEIKHRLSISTARLLENAEKIDSISRAVQSKFPFVTVEQKRTWDGLAAGITIDWRESKDWDRPRKAIEAHVRKLAFSRRKSRPLYVKTYSSHPFIDVYAAKCDKGAGFKQVLAEVRPKGQVLYLGDSENDNPAFALADISIGIRSDPRLKSRLQCDYYLEFDRLGPFLERLLQNDMVLSDDIVRMLKPRSEANVD